MVRRTRSVKRRQTRRRLTGGRRYRKRVTRRHPRGGFSLNPFKWGKTGSANLYTPPPAPRPYTPSSPPLVTTSRIGSSPPPTYSPDAAARERAEAEYYETKPYSNPSGLSPMAGYYYPEPDTPPPPTISSASTVEDNLPYNPYAHMG